MLEKRTFHFDRIDSSSLEVDVETTGDADLTVQYGHYTWRCAEALSAHLSANPLLVQGKQVLELGSGTGLCGLVSALLGANHVTFTDADPSVESNLVRNASANHVTNYTFHPLDWNQPCYKWKITEFDVLLASDCLFTKEGMRICDVMQIGPIVYEAFIRTAAFLLHTRPGTCMLTSIEPRGDLTDVWILCEKYLLRTERLEDTHVDNVQLYRITTNLPPSAGRSPKNHESRVLQLSEPIDTANLSSSLEPSLYGDKRDISMVFKLSLQFPSVTTPRCHNAAPANDN